jgi:aminoglycoside phosphotransferase (APT) family kinase protein
VRCVCHFATPAGETTSYRNVAVWEVTLERLAPIVRRRPSPVAIAWVERVLRTHVRAVERLRGGTSSAVHLLRLTDAPTGLNAVVLRRFVRADWLAEEPDLASHEARALEVIAGAGLTAPRLLAVDETGDECDVPAVLMMRVPGHLDLAPSDLDGYVRALAAVLPALHALGPAEGLPTYRPWFRSRPFEPPAWSSRPELWLRANDLASDPPPEATPTLIHRDYHPANVLWRYGRVSGVTDWVNAANGPAAIDVAHCRVNLSALFGVEVAEAFRLAYEAASGEEQHPYWDLLDALDTGPPAVDQWADVGRHDLGVDLLKERCEAYLESLVRQLG